MRGVIIVVNTAMSIGQCPIIGPAIGFSSVFENDHRP